MAMQPECITELHTSHIQANGRQRRDGDSSGLGHIGLSFQSWARRPWMALFEKSIKGHLAPARQEGD